LLGIHIRENGLITNAEGDNMFDHLEDIVVVDRLKKANAVISKAYGLLANAEWNPTNTRKEREQYISEALDTLRKYEREVSDG
jgi:hypothetical protein